MSMKKILLLLLSFVFVCTEAMADKWGITFRMTNLQEVHFSFDSQPVITSTGDEFTVSLANGDSVTYAISDALYFYVRQKAPTGINSAEATSAAAPVFSYANGVITASGMKAAERLSVYSIEGIQVGMTKAGSDGCASIDISSTGAGVYVVNTGSGASFKLLKK